MYSEMVAGAEHQARLQTAANCRYAAGGRGHLKALRARTVSRC
jgi:hypothetical protein